MTRKYWLDVNQQGKKAEAEKKDGNHEVVVALGLKSLKALRVILRQAAKYYELLVAVLNKRSWRFASCCLIGTL